MIPFDDALAHVLENSLKLGDEDSDLLKCNGRILAEDILADRDFPPFNRATKDGIAIHFKSIEEGRVPLKIEKVISAGMPQQSLDDKMNCVEIMTGAVVPDNTDTVVMYEHLEIENGYATICKDVSRGQDIHEKGSDVKKGTVLLPKNTTIGAAEIGVLASVGKDKVRVKKLPKICVVSTGNELVEVEEIPLPHQIRKSNTLSLFAALKKENICAERIHLKDEKDEIQNELSGILEDFDVVLLSGGVSKGKFDFIPEVMESLSVEKIFHRVAQRPGKPFWFGKQRKMNTVIFSFPGNPVSTFANYHIYFLPWLRTCLELNQPEVQVKLAESVSIQPPLTRFIQVEIQPKDGVIWASIVHENGSGDLTSLAKSDGFVCLQPREINYEKGELVPFIATKAVI